MGFLEFLSAVFGIVYFTAWTISFYPQTILNYRRKTTSGTTVDFHLLNVLGALTHATSSHPMSGIHH